MTPLGAGNEIDAGGAVPGPSDHLRVDALGFPEVQERIAEGVIAHLGEHGNVAAGPACGNREIGGVPAEPGDEGGDRVQASFLGRRQLDERFAQ